MRVVLLGAGEIGSHLAAELAAGRHDVTVIESDPAVARTINEALDVRVVDGNGASAEVLATAGVGECDVFFGLSSSGESNVQAASMAKALGAKKSVARVHSEILETQWLLDFRQHFGLDYLFVSERLAAVELAKTIRNPDCLIVEEIARGRVEIQQLDVSPGSHAAGSTLRELGLPARVRVGSVMRAGRQIVPAGDEKLQAGDRVTLFGNHRTLESVVGKFKAASWVAKEVRVIIFGGGETGIALAGMLEGARFRTRIFERDPKRCAFLSSKLRRATVINADATNRRILEEEQVEGADFFVSTTKEDEDNVMTCLQAHHLGVRSCLTLVHRADYAEAVMRSGEAMGILAAVSPRVCTAKDLMRFVTADGYHTLVPLGGGVDVIEFTVAAKSVLADRKVQDVPWPPGFLLVAVTRGSETTVPAAGDALQAGDLVVAMAGEEARRESSALLG